MVDLCDVRSLRVDVHNIQGLAAGHEQAIALGSAKAHVGAGLGHADHADALAGGCNHLHSGPRWALRCQGCPVG